VAAVRVEGDFQVVAVRVEGDLQVVVHQVGVRVEVHLDPEERIIKIIVEDL
jgi:ubiquinone biosynthesis protein UbiJ